jgi:hypothetical protein
MCTYSFAPAPESSAFASAKGSTMANHIIVRHLGVDRVEGFVTSQNNTSISTIQFVSILATKIKMSKKASLPKAVGVWTSRSDIKP